MLNQIRQIRERARFFIKLFNIDPAYEPFLISLIKEHPSFLKDEPSKQKLFFSRLDNGWSLVGKYLETLSRGKALVDLHNLAVNLGLREQDVVREARTLVIVGLLDGDVVSNVFLTVKKEELQSIFNEDAEIFDNLKKKMSMDGHLSKKDVELIQELSLEFWVLLELSRELKMSDLKTVIQQKIHELKMLMSKYVNNI